LVKPPLPAITPAPPSVPLFTNGPAPVSTDPCNWIEPVLFSPAPSSVIVRFEPKLSAAAFTIPLPAVKSAARFTLANGPLFNCPAKLPAV